MNDVNINKYSHIDNYISINYTNYFYKNPLIIQTFPETENQKSWFNFGNEIIHKYLLQLFEFNIKILKVNSNPEEGWHKIYNFLFILNYLFLIIIIITIFYVCKITGVSYNLFDKFGKTIKLSGIKQLKLNFGIISK